MNKKEAKENRIKEALESGDDSNLSKGEKKRLNKIKEAAAKEAAKGIDRKNYKTDAEYQAALAAKTSELAQDKKFQKSVNGVAKFGKNTEFGLWAQKHFGKGSLIGESARMIFGHDGVLAKNPNSVLGAFIRLGDPIARQRERDQIMAEDRLRQEKLHKPESKILEAMGGPSSSLNEGKKAANDNAREEYAAQQVQQKMQDLKKTGGKPQKSGAIALLAAKYLQENPDMAVSAAESKAGYDIKQMEKNGKDYAQIYAELGGDSALTMGIAKGVKAFEGLSFTNNIDMKSAAARESMRQIAAKNAKESGSLEQADVLLQSEQKNRKQSLDNIVQFIGKAAAIDKDSGKMQSLRAVLDRAGENDKYDDIVANIVDATGADEKLVKTSLSSQYSNFTNEVQFNSKIRRYKAEKSKYEAFNRAKSLAKSKVGDSIPEAELMEMIEIFADKADADYDSLNVNSLGFKMQQIKELFESGNLVDESGAKVTTKEGCDAMMDRLRIQMTNEVGDMFSDFAKKYTENVRKYDAQKRYSEEIRATGTLPVAESMLEQLKFILTSKLKPEQFELVFNDTYLADLARTGNMSKHGQILQAAVAAAEKYDYNALADTGIDVQTQEKLIEMVNSGKSLKGMAEWGNFEISSMGSLMANMGGESLLESNTTVGHLFGLSMANEAVKLKDNQLNDLKRQEASARERIRRVRERIPNLLANPRFKEIMKDIVDAQGNHAKSMQEMVKIVQANMDAADSGKSVNTEYIKKTMDALNSLRAKYPGETDVINSINEINGEGFATCTLAKGLMHDIGNVTEKLSIDKSLVQEQTTKVTKGAFSKVGS